MAKQGTDEVTIPAIAIEAFEAEAESLTRGPKPRVFSEEEIEKARQQEKDKMYGRIENSDLRVKGLEEQLAVLQQERDVVIKQAEESAKKEAKLLKQREFEELSAKELLLKQETDFTARLNTVESEWRGRLEEIDKDRQAQAALLEKERAHQELQTYIGRRMQEEQESIIPELLGMISGNTLEEVESSISRFKVASSAILESVQRATAGTQQRIKGVGVTAPPVGPMETQMEQQTLSAEDIRNMSMEQYTKMRDRLLNAKTSRGRF